MRQLEYVDGVRSWRQEAEEDKWTCDEADMASLDLHT